jgi:hypothetical protein
MQELVLNYDRTVRYTDMLVKEGLLQYEGHDRTFSATAKGIEVLELSKELAEYCRPINDLIEKYDRIYSSDSATLGSDVLGFSVNHPRHEDKLTHSGLSGK